MFNNIYNRRKVLITGHTGFKGSWLALWLSEIGAEIFGYALSPPTEPNHFQKLDIDMISEIGDIRDADHVNRIIKKTRPEIIFHLAAQPIVRLSYKDPADTFTSNVLGTINIFEASRKNTSVRAIVNITSDKCYENREWPWGYRETDVLGGYDPYSTSKSCAELITKCWRNSFFNINDYNSTHNTLLATCRSGNVIGGGDWGIDRLIPDIMRAVSYNGKVNIRNPDSVRPWQHVLEPLSGYLLLGQKLLEGRKEYADAWNFGPFADSGITVAQIFDQFKKVWPGIECEKIASNNQPHEAGILRLDCSKAMQQLHWKGIWDAKKAVEKTAFWYTEYYTSGKVRSMEDLHDYFKDVKTNDVSWIDK